MIAIALLLMIQQSDAYVQASKHNAHINKGLVDPFKNAEDLDRRYLALKAILDSNPKFKHREVVLGWQARLAVKTGRPAEALETVNNLIASSGKSTKGLESWYAFALRCAFLSMNRNQVMTLLKIISRDYPRSSLARNRPRAEKAARFLGKRGATVSLPTIDGKRFSWRNETKGKVVVLYFTASW